MKRSRGAVADAGIRGDEAFIFLRTVGIAADCVLRDAYNVLRVAYKVQRGACRV